MAPSRRVQKVLDRFQRDDQINSYLSKVKTQMLNIHENADVRRLEEIMVKMQQLARIVCEEDILSGRSARLGAHAVLRCVFQKNGAQCCAAHHGPACEGLAGRVHQLAKEDLSPDERATLEKLLLAPQNLRLLETKGQRESSSIWLILLLSLAFVVVAATSLTPTEVGNRNGHKFIKKAVSRLKAAGGGEEAASMLSELSRTLLWEDTSGLTVKELVTTAVAMGVDGAASLAVPLSLLGSVIEFSGTLAGHLGTGKYIIPVIMTIFPNAWIFGAVKFALGAPAWGMGSASANVGLWVIRRMLR